MDRRPPRDADSRDRPSRGPPLRQELRNADRVAAVGGGFVIPLTFGEAAGWYRNITVAGWCVLTYGGVDNTVIEPEIVDGAAARAAFPGYERLALRLIGVDVFLRLRTASAAWTQPPSPVDPIRAAVGD